MAADRPRAKSLVATVFGDSIAPHGGEVWLSQLVDLLAPFGVGDRLVRSSVFRLAKDGWLRADRQGRRSLYTLTDSGRLRFERAHQRIYSRTDDPWDGTWTFVLATDLAEPKRAIVRRELEWEGFRLIGPGILGRPAGDQTALGEILDRLECRSRVTVVSVRDRSDFEGRPLSKLRDTLWDLNAVSATYNRFLRRFESIAALAEGAAGWRPEEAFVVRTLLIHSFRRALLHDPLLPGELLPAPWPGDEAYALSRQIYLRVHSKAEERVQLALLTVTS